MQGNDSTCGKTMTPARRVGAMLLLGGAPRWSRPRRVLRVAAVAVSLLPVLPGRASSQVALSTGQARDLARIAEIEDARGTQGRDPAAIVPFLSSADPVIRWAAVRALGRQQSPRWLPSIYALLRDPAESVRLSAMNAVGQALQGLRSTPASSTQQDVLAAIDSLARAGAARNSDVEAGGSRTPTHPARVAARPRSSPSRERAARRRRCRRDSKDCCTGRTPSRARCAR